MLNTTPSVDSRFNRFNSVKISQQQRGEKRIKERKLKDEELRQRFDKNVQERNSVHHGAWKELSANVLEAAKEVCFVTTGYHRKQRGTWR